MKLTLPLTTSWLLPLALVTWLRNLAGSYGLLVQYTCSVCFTPVAFAPFAFIRLGACFCATAVAPSFVPPLSHRLCHLFVTALMPPFVTPLFCTTAFVPPLLCHRFCATAFIPLLLWHRFVSPTGRYSRYRAARSTRPPQRVLLTGASGFLGAHILASLLKDTTVDVFCLVRAGNEEEAVIRLEDTLKK